MRIKAPEIATSIASRANRVQERPGAEGGQEKGNRDPHQDPDKNSSQQNQIPVTEDQVTSAIETFSNDATFAANGLSIEKSGKGPGLLVMLKDGQGQVIRQMTGEEFVQLRSEVAHSAKKSGKVLDQKI